MSSYGAMRLGSSLKTAKAPWLLEAGKANARGPVVRAPRARLAEERAKSTSFAIASSLFLLLVAGALLVGGHAAIDPLLRSAIAARESKGIGDIVVTMPDGIYCRHMSFDNTTAEVTEGAIERCPDSIAIERQYKLRRFNWGNSSQ